ncbi:MAG: AAA family ATPase [Acutalibacter sp.]|jgi:hypothetical protein
MEITFNQLCGCSPTELQVIQKHTDTCAAQGRSYEFPRCLLPLGCHPAQACLGFWKGAQAYWIYLRPEVTYQGDSPSLAFFFLQASRNRLRFSSFSALASYLTALSSELPAQKPLLFQAIAKELGKEVLGQSDAVNATAQHLCAHVGKTSPLRPLSLVFHGPTGVGKSKLGKSVAPALNTLCGQERYRTIIVELNTFTQPFTVSRLTGAPPGYAGYGDPPLLQAVEETPYTVFLFDELDKAHPEVLKVFLSILDEGRLVRNGSKDWDFRKSIFLFTTNSNLSSTGARPLGFAPAVGEEKSAFSQSEEGRLALVRGGMPPELAGRFGGIIPFSPLSYPAQQEITVQQITALGREYGLTLQVSPTLAAALTPENSLSARSTAGLLQELLAPLFLGRPSGEYLLTGTAQRPRLLPKAEQHQAEGVMGVIASVSGSTR